MSSQKRTILALVANGLVLAIEIVILLNSYFGFLVPGSGGSGNLMFRFFTEDSNLLLGVSSLFFLLAHGVCSLRKTPVPSGIKILRYIATVAVTTTALVVLFFLAPYAGVAYHAFWYMWSFPNMFFTHFLCPVLSIVSFLFFEEPLEERNPWEGALLGLASVLLYAIIVGSLASTQSISSDPSVNNVYGFMDATAGAWWVTPLAFTLIISGTYFEGVFFLWRTNKRLSVFSTK
jgi:hypothetical protein